MSSGGGSSERGLASPESSAVLAGMSSSSFFALRFRMTKNMASMNRAMPKMTPMTIPAMAPGDRPDDDESSEEIALLPPLLLEEGELVLDVTVAKTALPDTVVVMTMGFPPPKPPLPPQGRAMAGNGIGGPEVLQYYKPVSDMSTGFVVFRRDWTYL